MKIKLSLQAALTLLAWVLGCIFIYAAVTKIMHPDDFAANVRAYRLLPVNLADLLALVLPWCELAAGLALFTPGWQRAGAWIVTGSCALFLPALGAAWVQGLKIPCGCFGSNSGALGLENILLDLAILAAALVFLRLRRETPLPWILRGRG